ncbi:MAG: CBS domain-containing protein, partial [Acidimicrobiales bacterium]
VDPLEALFVREVMVAEPHWVAPDSGADEFRRVLETDPVIRRQRLYPVLDEAGRVQGVVGWTDLLTPSAQGQAIGAVMHGRPVVAFPDETLRSVADRMAEHQLGALPVVERSDSGVVLGVVTSFELLTARRRQLEEERHREASLYLPVYRPLRLPRRAGSGRRTPG